MQAGNRRQHEKIYEACFYVDGEEIRNLYSLFFISSPDSWPDQCASHSNRKPKPAFVTFRENIFPLHSGIRMWMSVSEWRALLLFDDMHTGPGCAHHFRFCRKKKATHGESKGRNQRNITRSHFRTHQQQQQRIVPLKIFFFFELIPDRKFKELLFCFFFERFFSNFNFFTKHVHKRCGGRWKKKRAREPSFIVRGLCIWAKVWKRDATLLLLFILNKWNNNWTKTEGLDYVYSFIFLLFTILIIFLLVSFFMKSLFIRWLKIKEARCDMRRQKKRIKLLLLPMNAIKNNDERNDIKEKHKYPYHVTWLFFCCVARYAARTGNLSEITYRRRFLLCSAQSSCGFIQICELINSRKRIIVWLSVCGYLFISKPNKRQK